MVQIYQQIARNYPRIIDISKALVQLCIPSLILGHKLVGYAAGIASFSIPQLSVKASYLIYNETQIETGLIYTHTGVLTINCGGDVALEAILLQIHLLVSFLLS